MVCLFENTNFIYNNINSSEFGLFLVQLSTGSRSEPFGTSRSILEEKIPDRKEPYFYKFDYEPLEFTVTLAKTQEWDINDRLQVVRWLFQDRHKPFISVDNMGIIYNCVAIDSPQKILVGNIQRMIELTFRCDAPWAWTPIYNSFYDLSTISAPETIIMQNMSNIEKWYEPELEIIKKNGAGDVTITNLTDSASAFELTGLLNNEEIYVNNNFKQIVSNEPDRYPLNYFNRGWLRLAYGNNNIEVDGQCEISTRMRYPIGV